MKAFSNFLKQKKMLVQILMCGCKVEKFHREQNEHVKKWCNFQYHCDDSHLLLMYSSKANLFVASRIQEMDFHCACAKIRSNLFVIFVYKLDIFELQGIQNLWEKNNFALSGAPSTYRRIFRRNYHLQGFVYYSPTGKKVDISLYNPREKY